MHHGQVLLQRRQLHCLVCRIDCNIHAGLTGAVAAMVLHGHVEDEEGAGGIPLLIEGDHVGKVAAVTEIGAKIAVIGQFSINVVECVKAQKRIVCRSAIAVAVIRMIRNRRIAQALQAGRKGLLLLGHILHIGEAAGGQGVQAVAGDKFILRVGRAAADDRNKQISLDRVLLQLADKGQQLVVRFKSVEGGQVGEGFVHNRNDVGQVLCAAAGGSLLGCFAQNFVYIICAVAVRLVRFQASHCIRYKRRHIAIALCHAGNIPCLTRAIRRHHHAHNRNEGNTCSDSAGQGNFGPLPVSHAKGRNHAYADGNHDCNHCDAFIVDGEGIVSDHVHGGARLHNVGILQRIAPELTVEVVCNRPNSEEH